MVHQKQKFALLAIVVSVLLLFSACSTDVQSTAPSSDVQSESMAESSAPPPEPEQLQVTFSAVGDNLIHDGIYLQAGRRATDGGYDFSFCFDQVEYFFDQFDVNWMNQETLLNDIYPPAGYPLFSTPSQMAQATYDAGWRVYSLSNNHSYDLGVAGIEDTLRVWDEMPDDTLTTGFFQSREDDSGIVLQEVNGMTIAYLAYTDHTNGMQIPEDNETFVIYSRELETIERQVRRATELADAVIVGVHWEQENSHAIIDSQRTLAANLADWGATAVIGTHPHVIQPIEYVEGPETGRSIPVAYSLGNFLSAQAQANQMIGIAFAFDLHQTVDPDGTRHPVTVENVRAYPTVTHYGSGYADIHTYMYRDYTEELAQAHGVKARYPNFNLEFITTLCETYIAPEYLVLD